MSLGMAFPIVLRSYQADQHLIIISRNVTRRNLVCLSIQKLYGAPGVKPDVQRIKAYESYTLEHCENFKLSRMLQVTVSRCSDSLHCLFSF